MYNRPPAWQNANNPNMAPMAPRGARPPNGGPPPPNLTGTNGVPAGPASSNFPNGPAPGRGPPPGYGAPLAGPSSAPDFSAASADPSTTVFVGSITPGISDGMLKSLLATCGTLQNLKRISPAFGFASFDHPEAVMRAIDLLNGLALPPPGLQDQAEKEAKTKKLTVKADEKTKAFIEDYKTKRASRSTFEEDLDSTGKAQIQEIVNQLASPQALAIFGDAATANFTAVPAHLRDLPPEDLPEEHRSSVLGEIDKFRQASAAREEEKRRRERVLERERMQGGGPGLQGRPTGLRGAPAGPFSNGFGPQSYNQPAPGFVKAEGSASTTVEKKLEDLDPEEADEIEHKRKAELKAKDDERRAQESLASYTHREKGRLAHWSRIAEHDKTEEARRAKAKAVLIQRSENWNEEEERSRELFYVDRQRWRHMRAPQLRRELEEDEAEARAEEEEARKAKQEAEKFLARQEEEMRKHIEEQRKAGVLVDGANIQPLKLKLGANPTTGAAAAGAPGPGAGGSSIGKDASSGATTAAVLGEEVDDDSQARGSKIKVDLGDGMTAEERREALKAKRKEVKASLRDLTREDLYARPVKWEWIDEVAIKETYKPAVSDAITEAVGEAVPELEEVVLELIRGHKGAEGIEEAVEPVMAEDAADFTEEIWRMLLEETMVASSGLVVA